MEGTSSIETFDVSDHTGNIGLPFVSALLVLGVCFVMFIHSFGRRS